MSLQDHVKTYWKFFFEKGDKFPKESLPQQQVAMDQLLGGEGKELKTSWLGHSSLLINISGYTVLTDPVFADKVSPIGPARFNKQLPLNINDLEAVDVVIVSHDHYDHLNKFSIQKLNNKTGVFVVPVGVGNRLLRWGISESKIVELNWWDEYHYKNHLTITATPAQHFSGRNVFDRNKTLWASWVIRSSEHRVFFSGDTGYFAGFKEIGLKYGPFDVAFLECGAYDKRWTNVHMLPEQTVQAFFDLGAAVLQPLHWATFNLAFHPWYEPVERLLSEAWKRNVHVSTPEIGQVVNYSEEVVTHHWWLPVMEKHRKGAVPPRIAVDVSR